MVSCNVHVCSDTALSMTRLRYINLKSDRLRYSNANYQLVFHSQQKYGKQKFEFHFIQMKSIHCEVKVTFTCIFICDQRLHFLI